MENIYSLTVTRAPNADSRRYISVWADQTNGTTFLFEPVFSMFPVSGRVVVRSVYMSVCRINDIHGHMSLRRHERRMMVLRGTQLL